MDARAIPVIAVRRFMRGKKRRCIHHSGYVKQFTFKMDAAKCGAWVLMAVFNPANHQLMMRNGCGNPAARYRSKRRSEKPGLIERVIQHANAGRRCGR